MTISKHLLARDINGYSQESAISKKRFHTEGKAFMRQLAKILNVSKGFRISSNEGGVAVSGEVTLHADNIYLSMSEASSSQGVQIMYRGCSGLKDFSGRQNNFVNVAKLAHDKEAFAKFLSDCLRIMDKSDELNAA